MWMGWLADMVLVCSSTPSRSMWLRLASSRLLRGRVALVIVVRASRGDELGFWCKGNRSARLWGIWRR